MRDVIFCQSQLNLAPKLHRPGTVRLFWMLL